MTPKGPRPDESLARSLARAHLGEEVASCTRFPTGLAHWVYDVVSASGAKIVVRVGEPARRPDIAGGIRWTARLREVGVLVAAVLESDVDAPLPYMILERLPGSDLDVVHDDLDVLTRRRVSSRIVEMQHATEALGEAAGFGYAPDDDSPLAAAWEGVLRGSLKRSGRWIERAGRVDSRWATRVDTALRSQGGTFDDVGPRPFLHDVTTKNVIIDRGELSGIVDVDSIAYGDPLWTTALTRMSLLARGRPTDYVEAQLDAFDPDGRHRARFDLYTALHGLAFLGEVGQAFNRDEPDPVGPGEVRRLEEILASLLDALR